MVDFSWNTRDVIKSHEAYLRGTPSLAATLNWTTAESGTPTPRTIKPDALKPDVAFPDTLTDCPHESKEAVDFSDGTKTHDTSVSATNWDALLDTAGIPTDGTPPDPLAAQQQQEAMEEQAARQAMSQQPGAPAPAAPPAAPAPAMPAPAPAQGCGDDVGPTNPMDPSSKYTWDSYHTSPKI